MLALAMVCCGTIGHIVRLMLIHRPRAVTRKPDMSVLDDRDKWRAEFEAGWLKHDAETGEVDWKLYNVPRNTAGVRGQANHRAQRLPSSAVDRR